MKQITELSEKEILELTDEQLQTMVKYKMAEAGIKILERPIEPTYEPQPKRDDIAFSIGGLSFYTKDEKVAKEIGGLMFKYGDKFLSSTYPTGNYDHQYLKTMEEYNIKTFGKIEEKEFYTVDRVSEAAEIAKRNKSLKEHYAEKLKEFNEANEAADYIRIDIYDRVREVTAKHARMAELKYTYGTYLALADNDSTIAMNFLKKAYSVNEETEYFVQGKEMPERADCAPVEG